MAAAIVALLMVKLGFWQLSRAEEKQSIQNFLVKQQSQQIDLSENIIDVTSLYQQGHGSGRFVPEHAILIDNQVSEGRVGYHVIAPFKFEANGQVVLINLGWVSAGSSRQIKPDISIPNGLLKIQGRLQNPHAKPPIWNDDGLLVQNGIWQFLPIEEYISQKGILVAPLILELDDSSDLPINYVRQWKEYDDTWINRHKAYALQWFSMAVVFILMCLVLEFRSRRKPQ